MDLKDLITIIGLIIGLFLVAILYILLKRRKIKAKALPRALAIGAGVYTFVCSMTFNILLEPISAFANYTINNIFLSLLFGAIGYFSGRRFARNMPD
jgi:hypothetical protein